MRRVNALGDLERAVMDALWGSNAPQTVRQVHESLSRSRSLAYTTVMTVLQRLAKKGLVTQIREGRAHKYQAAHQREDLVASLMVDVLDSADAPGSRAAALVSFVGQVGADEAAALRAALNDLAAAQPGRDEKPDDPA